MRRSVGESLVEVLLEGKSSSSSVRVTHWEREKIDFFDGLDLSVLD